MTWTTNRTDERRLHIAVPVRLRGVDAAGATFDCEAWTLNVSATGASIQIPDSLALPATLRVTADDYQFHADADVKVIWERSAPQRAIGVRVLDDTPPAAWQAR